MCNLSIASAATDTAVLYPNVISVHATSLSIVFGTPITFIPFNDKSLADLSIANKLKSLFFQMDYIGMYSGAVVYSKENISDDSIQTSDNCSSALSILEIDGLFEREKSSRLGNNEFGFIGRFSNVSEMNETYNDIIGAKWEKDEDVIIYHKEYQI